MRFSVGDVQLTGGREVTNLVASVADVGVDQVFPAESLIFLVREVARNREAALAKSVKLTSHAEKIEILDVGDIEHLPIDGAFAPKSLFQPLTVGEVCLNSCQSAKAQKTKLCLSNYEICTAAALAVLGSCLLFCAPAAEACAPACIATYGVMTLACILQSNSCYQAADIDYDLCVEFCNTGTSEPRTTNECGSPIVINLDGRQGFRFTDAPGGVDFDLHAVGIKSRTAWTDPGYRQAFLVWDRNG